MGGMEADHPIQTKKPLKIFVILFGVILLITLIIYLPLLQKPNQGPLPAPIKAVVTEQEMQNSLERPASASSTPLSKAAKTKVEQQFDQSLNQSPSKPAPVSNEDFLKSLQN